MIFPSCNTQPSSHGMAQRGSAAVGVRIHSSDGMTAHYCSLPVPEGAYSKAGDNLFSKACCDRTRGNVLKLKEGI